MSHPKFQDGTCCFSGCPQPVLLDFLLYIAIEWGLLVANPTLKVKHLISQSLHWKESGLVFTSDLGTPIFPRNLVRNLKSKLAQAGLPDRRFHDLRHTTASLLLEKNVHPKIVSELLGHSAVTFTLNTYSHIINPINKVASSEMDDMFGTAMSWMWRY